jgi:23S rRNA pseudouridine1911/1915/1917 synthase
MQLQAGRQFLHAAWLRFAHPVTKEPLEFRSPLPADLVTTLVAAARDPGLADLPDPLASFGFFAE